MLDSEDFVRGRRVYESSLHSTFSVGTIARVRNDLHPMSNATTDDEKAKLEKVGRCEIIGNGLGCKNNGRELRNTNNLKTP